MFLGPEVGQWILMRDSERINYMARHVSRDSVRLENIGQNLLSTTIEIHQLLSSYLHSSTPLF